MGVERESESEIDRVGVGLDVGEGGQR